MGAASCWLGLARGAKSSEYKRHCTSLLSGEFPRSLVSGRTEQTCLRCKERTRSYLTLVLHTGKAPAALRLPSCRRDRPGVGTPPGQELDRSAFLLGTTHTHEPRTSAQYEARGANAVQACRSACSSSPSHARYLLSPFAPAHTHKGYGDLVLGWC